MTRLPLGPLPQCAARSLRVAARGRSPVAGGAPPSTRSAPIHRPGPRVLLGARAETAQEARERTPARVDVVLLGTAALRPGDRGRVERLGRYRRFRESAIEAWLEELETGGVAALPAARATPSRSAVTRSSTPSRPTSGLGPPRYPRRLTGPSPMRPRDKFQKDWTPFGPGGHFSEALPERQKPRLSGAFVASGRQDLNLRPPGPQPGALPDCATPRGQAMITLWKKSGRRGSNPFLELGRLPCNR